MKFNSRYLALFVLTMLIGCSPALPVSQRQPNTSPTLPVETATRPANSTSLLLTPTTAITLPTDIIGQCIGTQKDLPANLPGGFVVSGNYALYTGTLQSYKSPSYILAPATRTKIQLPSSGNAMDMSDFLVSPDKKLLAFYAEESGTNGRWVMARNDGKLLQEYFGKEYPQGNWQAVIGWIDDNRWLISTVAINGNPYPIIVFNPLNGKTEKEFLPVYPDIYSGSPKILTWGIYGLPETVYNSDLSMVVYPKNPITIALWDIEAGKEISQIKDYAPNNNAPLWLKNGKQFIINVSIAKETENTFHEEIVSVNADGTIKRLTHLVDQFGGADIEQYSESADGRYIAFWFRRVVPPSGIFKLAIYDTQTEETKIFCAYSFTYLHPPVWSPDGHQLLVAGFLENVGDFLHETDHYNYGTVFVDVDKGLLSLVEKDVIPVGWMISP